MASNDLNGKLEEAMRSTVADLALSGVTVNTGVDDDTLAAPYVVCSASGGEEEIKGSGIMRLSASVTVASNADDDTLAEHRARYGAVFDAFIYDTVAAVLTAAATGFKVYDVFFGSMSEEASGRKHINVLEMDVVCCGSDIS